MPNITCHKLFFTQNHSKVLNSPEPVFNVLCMHSTLTVPSLYRMIRFFLVVVLGSRNGVLISPILSVLNYATSLAASCMCGLIAGSLH
jgi:hypothetical protein